MPFVTEQLMGGFGEIDYNDAFVLPVFREVYDRTQFNWMNDPIRRLVLNAFLQLREWESRSPDIDRRIIETLVAISTMGGVSPEIEPEILLDILIERVVYREDYMDWDEPDLLELLSENDGAAFIKANLRYINGYFSEACTQVGDPTAPAEDQVGFFLIRYMELPVPVAAGIMANIQRDSNFATFSCSYVPLIQWGLDRKMQDLICEMTFGVMETKGSAHFPLIRNLLVMDGYYLNHADKSFKKKLESCPDTVAGAAKAAKLWYKEMERKDDHDPDTEAEIRQHIARAFYLSLQQKYGSNRKEEV